AFTQKVHAGVHGGRAQREHERRRTSIEKVVQVGISRKRLSVARAAGDDRMRWPVRLRRAKQGRKHRQYTLWCVLTAMKRIAQGRLPGQARFTAERAYRCGPRVSDVRGNLREPAPATRGLMQERIDPGYAGCRWVTGGNETRQRRRPLALPCSARICAAKASVLVTSTSASAQIGSSFA